MGIQMLHLMRVVTLFTRCRAYGVRINGSSAISASCSYMRQATQVLAPRIVVLMILSGVLITALGMTPWISTANKNGACVGTVEF
jgi:hypothetical protein